MTTAAIVKTVIEKPSTTALIGNQAALCTLLKRSITSTAI